MEFLLVEVFDKQCGYAVYLLWWPSRTEDKHIEDIQQGSRSLMWCKVSAFFWMLLLHEFDVLPASFILLLRKKLISTQLFKFKISPSSYKIAHFHIRIKRMNCLKRLKKFKNLKIYHWNRFTFKTKNLWKILIKNRLKTKTNTKII